MSKTRCLSEIIFILQTHPSKGVQKNMLNAYNTLKYFKRHFWMDGAYKSFSEKTLENEYILRIIVLIVLMTGIANRKLQLHTHAIKILINS